MKKIVAFGVLVSLSVQASSQTPVEFRQQTPRMIAYQSLPPMERSEDVQTNFLTQTWRTGTVVFTNTPETVTVPLLFDVYSNDLYFFRDGQIMEFLQPVKEFTIAIVAKGDTARLLYRRDYPAIHRNTGSTFYEVLVDGRFQLLRCKAKTIALYKDHDVPEEQRDYEKQLYYAKLPNGAMIQVKTDKDFMVKEMATYAADIEKICTAQKLKLKNEAQLKSLFLALNK